eukprot:scpid88604/ scgid35305/ 
MCLCLAHHLMSRRGRFSEMAHDSVQIVLRLLLIVTVCTWTSLAEARLVSGQKPSLTPLQLALKIKAQRRIRAARLQFHEQQREQIEQVFQLNSRLRRDAESDAAVFGSGTRTPAHSSDPTSAPNPTAVNEATTQLSAGQAGVTATAPRPSCRPRKSRSSLNNLVTVTGPDPSKGCKPKKVKLQVCQGKCSSISYAVYQSGPEGGVYTGVSQCCKPVAMEDVRVELECSNLAPGEEAVTVTLKQAVSCACQY